jgi:hypothetical protein
MTIDWKVVLPAVGLLGLSVYQFVSGDYSGGVQSVFAALAAFGVKVGFERTYGLVQVQNQTIALQNEKILAMEHKK